MSKKSKVVVNPPREPLPEIGYCMEVLENGEYGWYDSDEILYTTIPNENGNLRVPVDSDDYFRWAIEFGKYVYTWLSDSDKKKIDKIKNRIPIDRDVDEYIAWYEAFYGSEYYDIVLTWSKSAQAKVGRMERAIRRENEICQQLLDDHYYHKR